MENGNGTNGSLALLLTGGGARAAYQVGVLRGLARRRPDLRVPILTGVSAGGINIAHVAAGRESFRACIDDLTELWMELEPEGVFRVGHGALALGALRWGLRLASGGSALAPRVRGLLDTAPLRDLLADALVDGAPSSSRIDDIDLNLAEGRLHAVALSTVDYGTGRTTVWCAGGEIRDWDRADRRSVSSGLTVDHVLASAAIPLLFPAVDLGDGFYGDGGVRLTSPLSPPIHLGARRILAVSTRYARDESDVDRTLSKNYPTPAQVGGVLLNSVFLDLLDQDAAHLARINELLRGRRGQVPAIEGLRHVDLLLLRPSQDLGQIAAKYEPRLPKGLRFLTRGAGSRESTGSDFVSMMMFQGDYVEELIRLGEDDVEARAAEIDTFLEGACL